MVEGIHMLSSWRVEINQSPPTAQGTDNLHAQMFVLIRCFCVAFYLVSILQRGRQSPFCCSFTGVSFAAKKCLGLQLMFSTALAQALQKAAMLEIF